MTWKHVKLNLKNTQDHETHSTHTPGASIGTNLFQFKTDTLSLCFSLRRRQ